RSPGRVAPSLAAIEGWGPDPATRAVVLPAAGDSFCTGADLSGSRAVAGEQAKPHPGATRDAMRPSQRVIRALWDLEKPIIAAVNGTAARLRAHPADAGDLRLPPAPPRVIDGFLR